MIDKGLWMYIAIFTSLNIKRTNKMKFTKTLFTTALLGFSLAACQSYAVETKDSSSQLQQMQQAITAKQQGDFQTALKLWLPLAKQGNSLAQFSLGVLYFKGEGVKQDYTEAAQWLRKAAEQGDSTAQFMLGAIYRDGLGTKQNYIEAAKWFHKAAELNNEGAQLELSYLYADGNGVKKDYIESIKWLKKSAEQDYDQAQFKLAAAYYNGEGVKQDKMKAKEWLRKSCDKGLSVGCEVYHKIERGEL